LAQRIRVEVIDDIDGATAAAATVSFGLDGRAYEIDLSEEHIEELAEAIRPFIESARKVPMVRRPSPGDAGRPNQAAIREWARASGMKVSSRGLIPTKVIDAYQTTH
jgi:Lsr2